MSLWLSPSCWLLGCEIKADRTVWFIFYLKWSWLLLLIVWDLIAVCHKTKHRFIRVHFWIQSVPVAWRMAGIRPLLLQCLQQCLLLRASWQEGEQECYHIPVTLASWVDAGQYCGLIRWADCCEAKYSMNTSKSAESNGSPLWQWRHFPLGWIAIPMKTQVTAF